METAARAEGHGGLSRRAMIAAVGAFAKAVTCLLNSTTVHNSETLLHLVRSRPPGLPLLTVSNHTSTLDDPLMWGFPGFPTMDAALARWVLAAEDICFRNRFLSYCFRLGKCLPIVRGGGVYQENMNEAIRILGRGGWLHTFPEGKIYQNCGPISRLKWGTASLIHRSPVPPLVLPIFHSGFEKVMPEEWFRGKRPPVPLWRKQVCIVVGEPIDFDLPHLREAARAAPRTTTLRALGWPPSEPDGLDEAAQQWLYAHISDRIRTALEALRSRWSS
ncbi:phospholipid/glycerol acyltransferase family protein [Wolffia australiana]